VGSATISVDELQPGMFVHLDLDWWAHPFALSSFVIDSPAQIETIRTLGLRRLRWCPERSRQPSAPDEEADAATAPPPPEAAPSGDEVGADAARAQRRRELADQRRSTQRCQRQYAESARAWATIAEAAGTRPAAARDTAQALTRALLDKMMVDQDMCIRVLSEGAGDRAALHALNVTVIALLMGRVFGFDAAAMSDLGVGALLHDIGKLDLPLRARHPDPGLAPADLGLYRSHVDAGLAQAKRMGLTPGATGVIAQHHELADRSGFPARLGGDEIAVAARIVALVDRYDNLCNPLLPHQGLTPHEALSLIFAQSRDQFDATMLNAFIRMMGVYPPGSVVQLTDDRFALVVSANSSRPLKPQVLVADPSIAPEEALLLHLDEFADLGIRRSVRAASLPPRAQAWLSPRQRIAYFFEPHAGAAPAAQRWA
jgi:putative nucleotidyltransferase with HDIG domain